MSFEANKIIGAILAAMILAMVSGIVANILVHPTPLAKPVYEVAGAPAAAASSASAAAAPAGPAPIAPLMASANADAGKAKTQQCAVCHTFNKGGPTRIGPNLWGIVGSPIAEGRGFSFSSALTAKGKGQTWTLDNLNHWLWKPQDFAKGTKMTFIGLPKPQDRANVIAYLNAMSDAPQPLASLAGSAAAATGGAAAPAATAPASAPAAKGPMPSHPAAPQTPGPAQGANSSSSAVQGEQK
ncbi:MAG TPA: cytochrome c family protein [Stellaceae bacterium]|nr:cytochrome c family protein [Stellaceae bacterium]